MAWKFGWRTTSGIIPFERKSKSRRSYKRRVGRLMRYVRKRASHLNCFHANCATGRRKRLADVNREEKLEEITVVSNPQILDDEPNEQTQPPVCEEELEMNPHTQPQTRQHEYDETYELVPCFEKLQPNPAFQFGRSDRVQNRLPPNPSARRKVRPGSSTKQNRKRKIPRRTNSDLKETKRRKEEVNFGPDKAIKTSNTIEVQVEMHHFEEGQRPFVENPNEMLREELRNPPHIIYNIQTVNSLQVGDYNSAYISDSHHQTQAGGSEFPGGPISVHAGAPAEVNNENFGVASDESELTIIDNHFGDQNVADNSSHFCAKLKRKNSRESRLSTRASISPPYERRSRRGSKCEVSVSSKIARYFR